MGEIETIHFQVNGEPLATRATSPTVEEILEDAGAAASVDVKDLGSYFLENVADGKKYENLSDPVEVREGDKFVAIYMGKTPVA